MKAIVLVGGEGTRLRPLTYTTPKPLLPICNQPFLERQMAWLARHGVGEVVLSTGYLPDAFVERFPDGHWGSVRVRYAVEPEPLGTGGAIRFAARGFGERIVVCNGDVLTDLDLTALVAFHDRVGSEATIALTRVADPSRFGVVPTAPSGRVLAFVEKPPPGKAPTDWINAGTYVLEPSVLDRIPPGVQVSVEREVFPRMLERGGRLHAVQSDAFWLDIGVPRQYLDANQAVLEGRLGLPPVPGAAEQAPGVWVQGPVQVAASARLVPPVLLGQGCVIGPDAVVAGSVVGPSCRVGARAELTRSVLLEGAVVDDDTTTADAVVGPGARVLAGASIADESVIGAAAVVDAGTSMAGARVDPPEVRA